MRLPPKESSEIVARRDALVRIARATCILGGAGALAALRFDAGGQQARDSGVQQVRDFTAAKRADLPVELAVATSSESPAELVRLALAALGGMERFVAPGDVVAIKPNIGWDRLPVHAANTNPEVVRAVVEACVSAGARHVVVTDASCNDARRSFLRSGIWKSAHEAGAKVVLPAQHRFRELRIQGELLDSWPVYTPLLEADKVINVPVAKQHNLCAYTGAMKNWYGLLGGRRNRLHQNIHVSIADLATFMRPTLTVLDATRVLVRNGPQGGNLDDARAMHQVVASVDQVAADAYACQLIGVKPEAVGYMRLAEQRGLGVSDHTRLRWTVV